MSSQFGFTIQLSALHTYIDRTASFYLIVLKTPAGYVLAVETFPGSATTEDVTGLRPSTMYRFCVYGIDETGQAYKTSESLATTTDGKLYMHFALLSVYVGIVKRHQLTSNLNQAIRHDLECGNFCLIRLIYRFSQG